MFSDTRKSYCQHQKENTFLRIFTYDKNIRWRRGGSLKHLISKPRLSTNALAPNLGKIQNQKSQWVPHSEHWWFRIMLQKPEGWNEEGKKKFFFSGEGEAAEHLRWLWSVQGADNSQAMLPNRLERFDANYEISSSGFMAPSLKKGPNSSLTLVKIKLKT